MSGPACCRARGTAHRPRWAGPLTGLRPAGRHPRDASPVPARVGLRAATRARHPWLARHSRRGFVVRDAVGSASLQRPLRGTSFVPPRAWLDGLEQRLPWHLSPIRWWPAHLCRSALRHDGNDHHPGDSVALHTFDVDTAHDLDLQPSVTLRQVVGAAQVQAR